MARDPGPRPEHVATARLDGVSVGLDLEPLDRRRVIPVCRQIEGRPPSCPTHGRRHSCSANSWQPLCGPSSLPTWGRVDGAALAAMPRGEPVVLLSLHPQRHPAATRAALDDASAASRPEITLPRPSKLGQRTRPRGLACPPHTRSPDRPSGVGPTGLVPLRQRHPVQARPRPTATCRARRDGHPASSTPTLRARASSLIPRCLTPQHRRPTRSRPPGSASKRALGPSSSCPSAARPRGPSCAPCMPQPCKRQPDSPMCGC